MNDNNVKTSLDEIDSGWLRFWIVFSCMCLLLSILIPDVHMLKNRYLLTWVWEDKVVSSPGFHGMFWIYLLVGMSLVLLVIRSLFDGKYLAAVSVFVMTFVAFVLLTTSVQPNTPGIWTKLSSLWIVLFLCASGLVLCGAHLQKVFQTRHFPIVLLFSGGLLMFCILFLSVGPGQQGPIFNIFNGAAWKGKALIGSISVILIILVALVSMLSLKLNTRRGLSIFLRLVFLGIPVLVFFYIYLPVSAGTTTSIATVSFEAAQQTLWIYSFLMYPAAVASLIEWNTQFE